MVANNKVRAPLGPRTDSSDREEKFQKLLKPQAVSRKSPGEAETLRQLLASNQEMIQQLTRRLANMEEGNPGTGEIPHLTSRQEAVQRELYEARMRYKEALKRVAEEME